MKTNENYPYPHQYDQPTEAAGGPRHDEDIARQAVAAANETQRPRGEELVRTIENFSRGIIRLRVIEQQTTPGETSLSWDTFEPTR